jgi:hypothetical protein
VGRLCALTLDSPNFSEGQPLSPGAVMVTSAGKVLSFKTGIPQPVTGRRFYGCYPNMLTDPGTPVPYQRYLLTPDEPLPPLAQIAVMGGDRQLWTFSTTDQLDRANCETQPPPSGGYCQPAIQDCVREAGAPPTSGDAAAPDAAPDTATGGGPTPDASADAPPLAPDASAQSDGAAPADTPAPAADAATTTDPSSGCGCRVGGRGRPAPFALGLLLWGVAGARRPLSRARLRSPGARAPSPTA